MRDTENQQLTASLSVTQLKSELISRKKNLEDVHIPVKIR